MYENFYGFREKPFSLQPDPEFLYLGKKHSIAYTMLDYGVSNGSPITVITGEIGSGKTTLIRHLLNQLDNDITVGLISNTHKAFGELLSWICSAYSIDHKDMSKVDMYQAFVDFMIDEYAAGRRTVLIVDEAQNMDAETLEELRVLSNVNADKDQVLQLILVGQPELRDTLRQPDMEQMAQRVSVDYHLDALDPEETDDYICHRLKTAGGDSDLFEPKARRFIHYHSDGIPRLINNLCDISLVYGFASQLDRINTQTVYEVIQDKTRNGGGLLVNRKHKQTLSEFEPGLAEYDR
ncbi:MAG: tRNA (adenosine(37)-N6)-threonylcarbamoyltransferase complex ATPase subunit type 1 TsaE [Thiotrichales bacterium]|nr:tRNA (adenosine(37)-N6)-threonylcarbamoyltransferase complex ATPase subunit type 1 TsaE [Thiotrichales bacterium]